MSHGQTSTGRNLNVQKEGGPMDWYVEGPGRRVGYDDLTAIDWIFEYTKERQRKRLLYSSGQGIIGNIRKLLDAGNVWLVLIATGVAVGIIAAFIDVASDWLADLKTGFCKNGEGGGKFYLNRSFCCWGHDGGLFLLQHYASAHCADEKHRQICPNVWTGLRGGRLWEPTLKAGVLRLTIFSTFFTRYRSLLAHLLGISTDIYSIGSFCCLR